MARGFARFVALPKLGRRSFTVVGVTIALGVLGGWAFATYAMESAFVADPLVITGVVAGSLLLTIGIGVAMTWTALSAKPSAFLRVA